MNALESWSLGVALAMDCMTVSITCGILQKRFLWKQTLIMALLFGIFPVIMPLLGWMGIYYFKSFIEDFDHWIAFFLLIFIGGKMILESFKNEEEKKFDPSNFCTMLILSIATSIDALAIGISFSCMGLNSLESISYPLFAIGVTSFIFSIIGKTIGAYVGKKINIRAEIIGGTILILIAIKIIVMQ